jgi:hypothetical protein
VEAYIFNNIVTRLLYMDGCTWALIVL